MKKMYLTLIFLLIIIFITVFTIILFTPKEEVEKIASIMEVQEKIDKSLSCYGYSIDNPKVILNPYGNSPLTAIIMFETDDRVSFNITIKGKNNDDIEYKEQNESREHYILVHGLYQDYENTVVLSSNDIEKEINITTDKLLDIDLSTYSVDIDNDIKLFSKKDYVFGLDKYGELRYYLDGGYTGDIIVTNNNHLLLSNNRYNNDNSYTGIIEVNLLGKIYYEYNLIDGYKGLMNNVDDTKIMVLSENIVEIDRQTGVYIKEYDLHNIDSDWTELVYDKDNNEVIIYSDSIMLCYEYDTGKIKRVYGSIELNDELSTLIVDTEIPTNYKKFIEEDIIDSGYIDLTKDIYFINSKLVNLSKYKETETSKKNINIFLYDSYDEDILVKQEYDRLEIEGSFNEEDEVYVILDKFMGKRVYEIDSCKGIIYINNYGLSGSYSIYLSVNNKLYKLNKYVSF